MLRRRLFVPFIGAILVSCTTARPLPDSRATVPPLEPFHGAVGVAPDGSILLVREGSAILESWPSGATAPARRVDLPGAPASLRPTAEGASIVTDGGVVLVGEDGAVRTFDGALDVLGPERLVRRPGGISFETKRVIRIEGVAGGGRLIPGARAVVLARSGGGDSLLRVSADGARVLAGPFAAIDSFDVSPDGAEVAFSARRGEGFDVGLVATEGSEVRWVGPDPLDERIVRWAGRGNKIAFAIQTPAGAVVRSVHIPTGFQLSVPLPMARVRDLAWDAAAERLAVLVTSADAGERVETMRFDGTERRVAVAPAERSEGADQLAGVPGAVLFAPGSIRYNERLPLVIWETAAGAFVFHEGRARLQQNRRIGSVVLSPGATANPSFWNAISELGWVDPERVFVVAEAFGAASSIPGGIRATVLTRESSASSSDSVNLVRAEPGSLEDFAVVWLGERLRGFEREHDGN